MAAAALALILAVTGILFLSGLVRMVSFLKPEEQVASITVTDGLTGQISEISDPAQVQTIVDAVFDGGSRIGISSSGNGYLYGLTFRNEAGEDVALWTIVEDGMLFTQGHCVRVDTQVLLEQVNSAIG